MPDPSLNLAAQAYEALELARGAGAADAHAQATTQREVSFSYRDGTLEKVQENTSRALRLELYVDGRYASYKTTDLRPAQLSAFIDEAVALTRALEPDEHRALPDRELYDGRSGVDLELHDPGMGHLSHEARTAWLAEMDEALHADERVISGTSGVSDTQSVGAAANTNGFEGTWQTTSLWAGSEVTLQGEGERRPEAWDWRGARHQSDLPDPKQMAASALERAKLRLGSVKGPTRQGILVVDARSAGRLLRYFLRPAKASRIQQQRSFWGALRGEKPFSDTLSIIDEPLLKRGLGSRSFDGEGISARSLPIVENGRVKNVYVDSYYGRKAGMLPTTGSTSNVVVRPGRLPTADLIAGLEDAVLLTSWLGGNADDNTGDFSFGMRGHLITGGEVGGPVGEMNVTGNFIDLFSKLVAVGRDPWMYSSLQSPALVFEGVQFSGA